MPLSEDARARFEGLARELAERDAELSPGLEEARVCAQALRARAREALAEFRQAAERGGALHLARVEVGPVEPDEKHIDAVQVRVKRGRWEIVCVAKSRGEVTLVGPYRQGKEENPCKSYAFKAPELEPALDDLLLELLRQSTARR